MQSFQGATIFFASYREQSAGVRLAIVTSLLEIYIYIGLYRYIDIFF